MRSDGLLSFDKCLGALAQELKTPACKGHNLALAVLVVFVVRLDVAFGNFRDHIDDFVRLAYELHQS